MKDFDATLVASTSIVALGAEFVDRIAVGSPLTAAVLDVLHAATVGDDVPQAAEIPEELRRSFDLLLDPEFEVLLAFRSGAELVHLSVYSTGDTVVRFDSESDYRFWVSEPTSRADLAAVLTAQFPGVVEDSSPFSVNLEAPAYLAAMGWIAAYRQHWLPLSPDDAVISAEEVAAGLASDMVAETMASLAGLGAPTSLAEAYELAGSTGLDSLRDLGLIVDQPDGLVLTPEGAAALGPLAYTGLSLSLMAVRGSDRSGAATVLLAEAESGRRAAVVPALDGDDHWRFSISGPPTADDIAAALRPEDLVATPLIEGLEEWPAPLLASHAAAAPPPPTPPGGTTAAPDDAASESSPPATGSDLPPPPPPPAAAGTAGNPQWLKYLIYGGLLLALVGVGIGLSGGEDDGSELAPGQAVVDLNSTTTTTVESTTTTSAITTTTAALTTTTSSSTTTSTTTSSSTTTTTTAPAAILEDDFDGATTATPLFPEAFSTAEVNADGQLEMSVFSAGIIPTMYPDPLPDGVEISFDFNPLPLATSSSFGAVVMSEDPSDGVLTHYVAIFVFPSSSNMVILPWNEGAGETVNVPVPAAAGFASNQWNTMRLIVGGGQIDIFVNEVFVTTWAGVTPVVAGHWGPMIAGGDGDKMLVDNVLVQVVG